MVQHLFPKFLDDPSEYQRAQVHWERLVDQAAKEAGQQGEWRPWMVKSFADGTPLPLDGNPIFEAKSSRLNRAVRIVQSPPESDEPVIVAYLDRVGGEGPENTPTTDELVITLALSEETKSIAERLIRLWTNARTTRDQMAGTITELTTLA